VRSSATGRYSSIDCQVRDRFSYSNCVSQPSDPIALSTQPDVKKEHDHQTERQSERGPVLVSAAVGFGNDFVTDDIEHGAGGKGQTPRQNWLGETDDASAQRVSDLLCNWDLVHAS